MIRSTHIYGEKVAEFFKHDTAELQASLDRQTTRYHSNSEGLHYPGMAGNVDFIRHKPLELSLIELQDEILKGYTIVKVTAQALYFKAIMKKPEKVIKAELRKLEEQVRAEYDKNRYERNASETSRQVDITLSIKRRKEEAKAAAGLEAALAALQSNEEAALADLLREYSTPVETGSSEVA